MSLLKELVVPAKAVLDNAPRCRLIPAFLVWSYYVATEVRLNCSLSGSACFKSESMDTNSCLI